MNRQRSVAPTTRTDHRGSVQVSILALLALMLAMTIVPEASAQKIDTNQFVMTRILVDTAWARRPTFGIDSNNFWFGGVFATREPGYQAGTVGNIWPLARWLGLKIIEERKAFDASGYSVYDGLVNAANSDSNDRVIVHGGRVAELGWAREIILYPFDSSQSYYWQSIFRMPTFASRPGGDTLNASEADYWNRPSRERVYHSGNTTAGATILYQMAFGYDSVFHLRRYPGPAYDENVENTTEILARNDLATRAVRIDSNKTLRSRFFAVRGHLFDGGAASNTDTLLLLDIYNEIPKGTTYLNSSGVVSSDTSQDLEILYATIPVLKADLNPTGGSPNYDKYVEKTYHIDLVRLQPTSGMGGPLHPDNTAHRFDLRVRWTGKEKVALRSIAIRDSAAELLIGTDPSLTSERHNLRVELENEVDRIMRGVNFQQDTATTNALRNARMQKILRFYSGDEGLSMMTGLNYLDSFLYRRFPNLSVDTLTRGIRAFRAQPGSFGFGAELLYGTSLTEQEIPVELYAFEGTNYRDYDSTFATRFGLPAHIPRIPSLSEHNGGRFTIPLLNIDGANPNDSVNIFSLAIQRQTFGAYTPGGYTIWPWLTGINNVGHAASVARRTGRRLIVWPGVMTNLKVFWQQTDTNQYELRDTLFSHQTEIEEQKLMVNLTLAYGGSGIHLSWVGSDTNEFGSEYKHLGKDTVVMGTDTVIHDTTLYHYESDLGLIGQFTKDTTSDVLSSYVLENTNYLVPHRVEIPNLWTGWQSRSRGMRWLTTTWIPGLWPTLRHLHWRDGYSIHFATVQTWHNPPPTELETLVPQHRPIKAGEVISGVQTYGRDDTLGFTRLDPAMNTFVEVGLFDTQRDMSGGADPYKDTTFIMVVNRRTFARGADISSTSDRGKKMDSLAEWRRVLVHLNLPRRDSTRYTFVRVREVYHDTTRLPFSNAPHQGLDTAVANDSSVAVLMSPGSGTLLEITYLKPDTDLDGLLAFNNGKKIIFDGTRYFATYARFDHDSNYISSVNDSIFFRWSNPVSSPQEQIVWNPIEYVVSNAQVGGDTRRLENRTPSITLRTVNGDTVVTVVWTAHSINTDSAAANKREVVARDIVVVDPDGGGPSFNAGLIRTIAYYKGSNAGLYGTSVVSRLDGGEMFVWSDSTRGICAAFRTRPFAASEWWKQLGKQSASQYLNDTVTNPLKSTARFPSMPAITHIATNDSSVSVVWQQDGGRNDSTINLNHIWYTRLTHYGKDPTTQLPLLHRNTPEDPIRITDLPGHYSHPSIDQWQCWWGSIYEGLIFEDNDHDRPGLVYRPLHSDTVYSAMYGTVLRTYRWTPLIIQIADNTGETWKQGYMWPSIASLNEVINAEAANDTTFFAVAYEDSAYDAANPGDYFHKFRQAQIWFGNSVAKSGFPKEFLYNGYFPSTSSSPVRQELHAATLYQSKPYLKGKPTLTRTTRQFFGKARPTGYIAKGREATIRIDDSTSTGMSLRLNDVWIAGDSSAQGLAFVDRGSPSDTLDTLSQLNDVLRTDYFHAHDSVTIGCNIVARFTGDSALADTFWVDAVIELIDSANPSTGAIVLDSFRVSASLDSHVVYAEPTLDLVSGTYQIRMRLATNVPAPPTPDGVTVYPIGDIIMSVDDPPGAGKIRRVERSGGVRARLSLQPNPVVDYTEIRFSIPAEGRVTVRVINQRGEQVAVPVRATPMETGRYAVGVDTRGMQPGVYVVELTAGKERVVEKMVIAR